MVEKKIKMANVTHTRWAFYEGMDANDIKCMASWFETLYWWYKKRGKTIRNLKQELSKAKEVISLNRSELSAKQKEIERLKELCTKACLEGKEVCTYGLNESIKKKELEKQLEESLKFNEIFHKIVTPEQQEQAVKDIGDWRNGNKGK